MRSGRKFNDEEIERAGKRGPWHQIIVEAVSEFNETPKIFIFSSENYPSLKFGK
jgi:hypothetical protein